MSFMSRRGYLAISAVVQIAMDGEIDPVSARVLADDHGLRPRHLEPMLQDLVRAGILKGVRGPLGGYYTSRDNLTCGEIVRAAVNNTSKTSRPDSKLIQKVVRPKIDALEARFLADLDTIVIAELCQEANG